MTAAVDRPGPDVAGSWLFVPGTQEQRFAKAHAAGATQVVIDWEDAVDPSGKEAARAATGDWLRSGPPGRGTWIRVNDASTAWHEPDLALLRGTAGVAGVMVPKAEECEVLAAVHHRLGRPVVALVETALGIARARELARTRGVVALAFGSLDLAHDLRCAPTDRALLAARSEVVLASRLGGLAPPIDGVTPQVRDLGLAVAEARAGRELGFGAKLCVHPAQVGPVQQVFAPSPEELDWARAVLAAAADSPGVAVGPGGEMVDRPVVERAHAMLRSAAATPGAAPPSPNA